MKKYDYIITGGGAAGLSLIIHLLKSGKFSDKQILLIEKDARKGNDRTWCFWEQEPGMFEEIVYSKYNRLWFHSNNFSSLNNIEPYNYKLIRGSDFYKYCHQVIRENSNVHVVYGNVSSITSNTDRTYVTVESQQYEADYIFNSILFEKPTLNNKEYLLLQHFTGWVIRTNEGAFSPDEAILMDFRTPQSQGTTFVYVMPFSTNRALVEYTLFSPAVLPNDEYTAGLKKYISDHLKISAYVIEESEFGIIPMTNYRFPRYHNNIINIGTAGGDTKASSGYTFRFIQKHCEKIVSALDKTGKPFLDDPLLYKRFAWYDSVLLNVLHNRSVEGAEIFEKLFRFNDMKSVLRFLDNETTPLDEMKLISVLPTLKFMKAGIDQLI